VFGARLWAAALLGLGVGTTLFLLFDRVLEIPLPHGVLAGILG
jgi:putative tricarboxylic transport membrane protein